SRQRRIDITRIEPEKPADPDRGQHARARISPDRALRGTEQARHLSRRDKWCGLRRVGLRGHRLQADESAILRGLPCFFLDSILSVSTKATLLPGGFGSLLFRVELGDGGVWIVRALHDGSQRPRLMPVELLLDGQPVVPRQGVAEFPLQRAQLAVEAEIQRL